MAFSGWCFLCEAQIEGAEVFLGVPLTVEPARCLRVQVQLSLLIFNPIESARKFGDVVARRIAARIPNGWTRKLTDKETDLLGGVG
jgi:hypothetical protein